MQVSRPPALATGLVVFLIGAYALNAYDSWHLTAALNLTALSMWPMAHPSFIQLIIHVTALSIPIGIYERKSGTVHTGVVLNITAVIPGLIWMILFSFIRYLSPSISKPSTWGCFSWALVFLAWLACDYHLTLPRWRAFDSRLLPVLIFPVLVIFVDFPRLLSYAMTTTFGYLLYYGVLAKLVEPPSDVIRWIESRIAPVISLLSHIVEWYLEVDAKPRREDREQVGDTSFESV